MKIVVVSNHFIVANSLCGMLNKVLNISEEDIKNIKTISELEENETREIDYVLIYLNKESIKELESIKHLRNINKDIKVIIIDLNKDENIFVLSMKYDVDSYISNISDEDDFKYVMNKIINGTKYYESELMNTVIKKGKRCTVTGLTRREKEILLKIGEGYSNKEISEQLCIAETTTKRHITNLFNKLKLRNRSEIIAYVHNNSLYF